MTRDSFWDVFEATGNIEAYLAYVKFRDYEQALKPKEQQNGDVLLQKEAK